MKQAYEKARLLLELANKVLEKKGKDARQARILANAVGCFLLEMAAEDPRITLLFTKEKMNANRTGRPQVAS